MGGRKIDDHSSWVGSKPSGKVFPDGSKTKEYTSADSAGDIAQYEDTTERIKRTQEEGTRKVKSHPMKPGYRY